MLSDLFILEYPSDSSVIGESHADKHDHDADRNRIRKIVRFVRCEWPHTNTSASKITVITKAVSNQTQEGESGTG
jgi:hypothetical protein